jgi:hypothetical protein
MDKAKAFLRELYDVDPDYQLDSQQFSPKVVALAVDARKETNEVRCRVASEDARKLLQSGKAGVVVDLIDSLKSKCSDVSELAPDAADLLYKRGLDEYRHGEFSIALQDFRNALKLNPKHELAGDYAGIAEGKLQLTADRLLLEWRKHFDASEFREAAVTFRELRTLANAQTLAPVQSAYREVLSSLVQSWNRTCPTGNSSAMQAIRTQIDALLPEPSFGEDIRAQMTECRKSGGCVPTSSHAVMMRLKSRVNPDISREMRSLLGDNQPVHVKFRLDENGNVAVTDVQGFIPMINNAVRNAVERWKFSPVLDENGARCVETEIVISIAR